MQQSPLERRVLRVMAYIHANPAADLSLDALADVAAMSRFHWHRVFRALTGETCASAVRRIRLHIAANELARDAVVDLGRLAASVGYPDRDSFARAFSAQYGMSPARFRDSGKPLPMIRNRRGKTMQYPVDIRDIPARRLFGLPHQGAYFRINEAYDKLGTMVSARGLWDRLGPMVAVFYSDVSSVPEADLRSFAALEAPVDMALPEGLEERHLDGGAHAVLTYRGPYANLASAYDYLFGTWLAGSGREPGDGASYELYLNSPIDTAPDDLMTEIHLPLKPA